MKNTINLPTTKPDAKKNSEESDLTSLISQGMSQSPDMKSLPEDKRKKNSE
jgi:hypothetical protein